MDLLNVHAIDRRGVRSLGPGLRYAIWLQGCPFDCKGCATPEAKGVVANKIYTVDSVANDIIQSSCDGLTISGGEPFLQAAGLGRLLSKVQVARPEMSVVIFTGFQLENLTSKDALDVIHHADVIIDGPYIERLNDGKGLRGSSNQRVHILTDRLISWKDEMENGSRHIEININNSIDNLIESVGIPLKTE